MTSSWQFSERPSPSSLLALIERLLKLSTHLGNPTPPFVLLIYPPKKEDEDGKRQGQKEKRSIPGRRLLREREKALQVREYTNCLKTKQGAIFQTIPGVYFTRLCIDFSLVHLHFHVLCFIILLAAFGSNFPHRCPEHYLGGACHHENQFSRKQISPSFLIDLAI